MNSPQFRVLAAGRPRVPPGDNIAGKGEGAEEPRTGAFKIVLASGDPLERERWIAHLGQPGYVLIPAADGEAALKLIQAEPIDLVIAAIIMTKLDGLELVRSLPEEGRKPSAILISEGEGETDRIFLKVAKLYGAAATFTQPLDADAFRLAVRRVLDQGDIELI